MPSLFPLPPRRHRTLRHRILPWLLFALLWSLAAGLLVAGSRIAEALAG